MTEICVANQCLGNGNWPLECYYTLNKRNTAGNLCEVSRLISFLAFSLSIYGSTQAVKYLIKICPEQSRLFVAVENPNEKRA